VIELTQGRAAVLRVAGAAASANATFNGATHALLPRQGGFWGILGIDADQAPGPYPLWVSLYDGSGNVAERLSGTVQVYAAGYPVEQVTVPPEQSGLLDPALAQQEAATRASVFSTFTPQQQWEGAFLVPVAGRISSSYGIGRSYNGGPVTSYHSGADFAQEEGTPIAAANAGVVAYAGALPIRGNSVIIDHGAGVYSAYHHLQGSTVAAGQSVAKGDLVGYLGGTGLSTGPHLHWEILVNGVNVDPVPWTEEQYAP
jgi:murein DD-endopeptidase MepM/ murein hydrolase activator NlpD